MSYKPDHMPVLSIYLTVQDPQKSLEFYSKAFGFSLTDEIIKDDDGNIFHAAMSYNGALIMFGSEGSRSPGQLSPKTSGVAPAAGFYIYTNSCDDLYTNALANNAVGIDQPEDTFWGDRVCKLSCPDGYHWSFATFKG